VNTVLDPRYIVRVITVTIVASFDVFSRIDHQGSMELSLVLSNEAIAHKRLRAMIVLAIHAAEWRVE